MEDIESRENSSVRKNWLVAYFMALAMFVVSTILSFAFPILTTMGPINRIGLVVASIIGLLPYLALYMFAYRKRGTRFLHAYMAFVVMSLLFFGPILLQYKGSFIVTKSQTFSIIADTLCKIYLLYHSVRLWRENRSFQIKKGTVVSPTPTIFRLWVTFLVTGCACFLAAYYFLKSPIFENSSSPLPKPLYPIGCGLYMYWMIVRAGIQRKSVLLSVSLLISTPLVVFVQLVALSMYFVDGSLPYSTWILQSALLVTGLGFLITSIKLLVENVKLRAAMKREAI